MDFSICVENCCGSSLYDFEVMMRNKFTEADCEMLQSKSRLVRPLTSSGFIMHELLGEVNWDFGGILV